MSDTKKMSCFCGCQTFTVHVRTFGGNYKHHVSFRCAGCECLRQITSPGYSADYVIAPPLLSEPPVRASLVSPTSHHSDGKVDYDSAVQASGWSCAYCDVADNLAEDGVCYGCREPRKPEEKT